jgi:hypothetical protein
MAQKNKPVAFIGVHGDHVTVGDTRKEARDCGSCGDAEKAKGIRMRIFSVKIHPEQAKFIRLLRQIEGGMHGEDSATILSLVQAAFEAGRRTAK